MSGTIAIRDPRAELPQNGEIVLPALGDLSGKTLAILSNGWTSMDRIAAQVGDILRARYHVGEVLHVRIPIGNAAEPGLLDSVAARGDFAIVGLAN